MPNVRKLNDEEIQQINKRFKSQRRIVEEEYDLVIGEYTPGEYGVAHLDRGENRVTIRNRLRAAAGRRGLGVEFQRTNNNSLRFKIVGPSSNGTSLNGSGHDTRHGTTDS